MNNQKGFTLIDLIVASSVMMFLVSNSIYFAKQYRQNAMNALSVATVKSLGTICSGMVNDVDELEKTASTRRNNFCTINDVTTSRNFKSVCSSSLGRAMVSNVDDFYIPKNIVAGIYIGFDPFYQFDLTYNSDGQLIMGHGGNAGAGKDLSCGALAFSPKGTKKYVWFESIGMYAEENTEPPFWCGWSLGEWASFMGC